MQAVGFLDLIFIALVIGVWSTMFWKCFKKASPSNPYQIQADEEFQRFLDSLRRGGRHKDYKRAKKALKSKE